ncbi:hypothetical protein D3C73_1012670 [compost metagenome]
MALDGLLRKVLDVRVDGQLDVAAIDGRGEFICRHRNPEAVSTDLKDAFTFDTPKNLVLGLLDAGLSVGSVLEETNHPAGNAAVGIDALADTFCAKARDIELGDPVLQFRLNVLCHHEVLLISGQ